MSKIVNENQLRYLSQNGVESMDIAPGTRPDSMRLTAGGANANFGRAGPAHILASKEDSCW